MARRAPCFQEEKGVASTSWVMMQTGSTSGDFLCVNIDTLERVTWGESSFLWASHGKSLCSVFLSGTHGVSGCLVRVRSIRRGLGYAGLLALALECGSGRLSRCRYKGFVLWGTHTGL